MSRRLFVAALAVVAVAIGAIWLGSGGASPGVEPSASATLPPIAAADSVSSDARVVPARRAELDAPAGGGVVADVFAEEGATVVAGAPLLRLDDALAATEVASAEAALAAATAAAAQADAAADQSAAQVEAATAAVEEAKAAVTAADAQRDGLPSGSSANQRRAANAEVTRANAAVRAARAQRDASRDARTVATRAADVARAEIIRADAAVAAATTARDELTLVAPFDGVVASVDAVVGETVAPGDPIVRVADRSAWVFETTDLDETSIGRITEGAHATVSLDAFPDATIEGRVASIAPFGDLSAGDVVYAVIIEPTGPLPDGLRWNMTASATIDTAP